MKYLCLVALFALDQRNANIVEQVSASGQVVEIATPSSQRLNPPARSRTGEGRDASAFPGFQYSNGSVSAKSAVQNLDHPRIRDA